MLLGAFLVLCIIGTILSLIICKYYRKMLVVLFICGFALGFITEYVGVHRDLWGYGETDTFLFFNIPFEILILYATALMYGGLMVLYLVKVNKKYDMDTTITGVFFIIGVLLSIAFVFGLSPMVFPLGFFALWGLSISKMRFVPLMLGLITFVTDFIVEGSLMIFTDYYEWTLEVPFAFMFFAIAFAGYATAGKK